MHAAALAALPFKIPVAHIHGGEETLGAIDNSLRHSITKLSHLHFAATQEYARRLIQLGEEPWRIIVSGAPSLDNLRSIQLLNVSELNEKYRILIEDAPFLVTFHPVTLEYEKVEWQMSELLAALEDAQHAIVFTMPNADTNNRIIRRLIAQYVETHDQSQVFESLGTQCYFSLMATAAAMVGNSSSGIIEAASFRLPVVNIGSRQKGRLRAPNVIDVGYDRQEILRGIERATSERFRMSLLGLDNPYGDGHAAERIVDTLRTVNLDDRLICKPFFDLPASLPPRGE
jgi:UDP-hydrolysing UDP-N-acetyl-D-glucosamine 2-epimerase